MPPGLRAPGARVQHGPSPGSMGVVAGSTEAQGRHEGEGLEGGQMGPGGWSSARHTTGRLGPAWRKDRGQGQRGTGSTSVGAP